MVAPEVVGEADPQAGDVIKATIGERTTRNINHVAENLMVEVHVEAEVD